MGFFSEVKEQYVRMYWMLEGLILRGRKEDDATRVMDV